MKIDRRLACCVASMLLNLKHSYPKAGLSRNRLKHGFCSRVAEFGPESMGSWMKILEDKINCLKVSRSS